MIAIASSSSMIASAIVIDLHSNQSSLCRKREDRKITHHVSWKNCWWTRAERLLGSRLMQQCDYLRDKRNACQPVCSRSFRHESERSKPGPVWTSSTLSFEISDDFFRCEPSANEVPVDGRHVRDLETGQREESVSVWPSSDFAIRYSEWQMIDQDAFCVSTPISNIRNSRRTQLHTS